MPQLSIVMPLYNLADYLESSIAALSELRDIAEFILVDDGSSDGTRGLAESLLSKYQLAGSVHSTPEGPSGSPSRGRNVGLPFASGNFVYFCDGDDLANPVALRQAVHILDTNPRADVLIGNAHFFSDATLKVRGFSDKGFRRSHLVDVESVTSTFAMSPWILGLEPALQIRVFRLSFLRESGLVFADGAGFEDYSFQIQVAALNPEVIVTRLPMTLIRQGRAGQVTATNDARRFDLLSTLKSVLVDHPVGLDKRFDSTLAEFIFRPIFWCGQQVSPASREAYSQAAVDLYKGLRKSLRPRSIRKSYSKNPQDWAAMSALSACNAKRFCLSLDFQLSASSNLRGRIWFAFRKLRKDAVR